ncbi:copper chaperone PCu(A)C [Balneola sp. MJW-20]|uniref:copper chaperone PCu(A)C n=1 Tax=Gracilimonas aurantiaca TaxID=3234185 RepID=UPI0034658EE7
MKYLCLTALSILSILIVAGCGTKTKETETAPATIDGVRPATQGMMSTAYFKLVIEHADTDTLISAESEIAGDVQIHESYMTEDGMAGMREVGLVAVSRGDSLIFERGGMHLMLLDLKQDLDPGDTVRVELLFSSGKKYSSILTVFDN